MDNIKRIILTLICIFYVPSMYIIPIIIGN